MEGQRGRPTWTPRPYVPIESRECYECGKFGHISYNCPKLQTQGKLANITKSNQVSCDEHGRVPSDEYDTESFLDEEYAENEYEIQAFMARGQEERQKRADAWAAQRRREEEAAPVQSSALVQPSGERVGAPPK